ncbi:uncharacterized protein UTRI_02033 [Ustilago trichophora]|uniref:Uncharacterized protein n=1 Tax=Ustilago trichophora TaxID=86804 RepID=A0A5C3DYX3_9BASI|nr:uncharacterized protein UTRI_02033 [Ustilago trichophora]
MVLQRGTPSRNSSNPAILYFPLTAQAPPFSSPFLNRQPCSRKVTIGAAVGSEKEATSTQPYTWYSNKLGGNQDAATHRAILVHSPRCRAHSLYLSTAQRER